jgi:hypothetical protein
MHQFKINGKMAFDGGVWQWHQDFGTFSFQLRVGDVIFEDGARLEVGGRPTGLSGGKIMRARVRRQREAIQHEAMWGAWRKLRVTRAA